MEVAFVRCENVLDNGGVLGCDRHAQRLVFTAVQQRRRRRRRDTTFVKLVVERLHACPVDISVQQVERSKLLDSHRCVQDEIHASQARVALKTVGERMKQRRIHGYGIR